MVKKIKKRTKKGSGGTVAVPMAMVLTCLYGIRLEGREFRNRLQAPGKIREVLEGHLGWRVHIADRVVSPEEFRAWELKSSPARLAKMSPFTGVIPMGAPAGRGEGDHPMLGILPIVAVADGIGRGEFIDIRVAEFSELHRVAFLNAIASDFSLIPGYDQLLYVPPVHTKRLNEAIATLNEQVRETFYRAGVEYPGPFEKFPERVLSSVPLREP